MKIKISTNKLPYKAIIITKYCVYDNKEFDVIINSNKYHVYIVKHCDRRDIPTHIVKHGVVNTYGYLMTQSELELTDDILSSIDIQKGQFKNHEIQTVDEVIKFLA